VRYLWEFIEVHPAGDTARGKFRTLVRRADLAGADRWRESLGMGESGDYPGYTIWTMSTAAFERLRTAGSTTYAVMSSESRDASSGPLAGFLRSRKTLVLWRGTLTRQGAGPRPFPLIVNGERVSVPALQLRGEFTATRQRRWEIPEIWVLADSTHPLFVKVAIGDHVWQTVRIDAELPPIRGAGVAATEPQVEQMLIGKCRVEIPGIYFAFNSAALYPASDTPIAAVAEMLTRHPDWRLTIEGHTDSIGSAASNRSLSERRAAAIRDRLVSRHGASADQLQVAGYGASRSRESNQTIEGRARNRRVELVRDCPTGSAR
jgi:outer membrane protein OmpA-like peptidoglycan-associated protein